MINDKKKARSGGYSNYSLRSATLVKDYVPGASRTNLLMDPDRALGEYTPGLNATFESVMNGPGSLIQGVPDASRYGIGRIFEVPRGNIYREFEVDDSQIADYQIEQLVNNPLSQYTKNPDGQIPKFDCSTIPDSFSNVEKKRKEEYKKFFEGKQNDYTAYNNDMAQRVYNQYSGEAPNPNASIVYNLSLNSKEDVNPFIASSPSRNIVRTDDKYNGGCYSGKISQPTKIQ